MRRSNAGSSIMPARRSARIIAAAVRGSVTPPAPGLPGIFPRFESSTGFIPRKIVAQPRLAEAFAGAFEDALFGAFVEAITHRNAATPVEHDGLQPALARR